MDLRGLRFGQLGSRLLCYRFPGWLIPLFPEFNLVAFLALQHQAYRNFSLPRSIDCYVWLLRLAAKFCLFACSAEKDGTVG